jgi:hypothetical protein
MGGLGLNTDAHIIINQAGGQVDGVGGPHVVAVVVGDGDDDDGVEDGLVSLNTNDDFAMGAPPGAPGAIGETPVAAGLPLLLGQQHHHHHRTQSRGQRSSHHHPHHARGAVDAPDVTPRAGFVGLPDSANATPMRGVQVPSPIASQRTIRRGAVGGGGGGGGGEVDMAGVTPLVHPTALGNSRSTASNASTTTANAHRTAAGEPGTTAGPGGLAATASNAATHSTSSLSNHPSTTGGVNGSGAGDNSGPYRDEDVLLALQLLAYLSKYPHVRQAFYKSRVTFHPASVVVGFTSGAGARGAGSSSTSGVGASGGVPPPPFSSSGKERGERGGGKDSGKEGNGGGGGGGGAAASFLRSFRGKETATPSSSSSSQQPTSSQAPSSSSSTSNTSSNSTSATAGATAAGSGPGGVSSARQTNVFSLVERFTFKPSSTETELPNPPPRLPPEIQYWAGVIMRNACRKDDGRGGIRQCANSEFSFVYYLPALLYAAICYTTLSLLLRCAVLLPLLSDTLPIKTHANHHPF